MSQQALIAITDKSSVRRVCRGWLPPLEQPRSRAMVNPFTGEQMERPTRLPAEFDQDDDNETDRATVEEVVDGLSNAKPKCIEVTLSKSWRQMLRSAPVFLIFSDGQMEYEVLRIENERHEHKIIEELASGDDELCDANRRREADLHLFAFIYSY